jgi:plasmid stability protein
VARTPTLVQLSDDLIARLDSRAATTRRSRSDLIREAIEGYLADDRSAAIDAAIVDSYTRIPPDEDFGASWSARTSIGTEPWEGSTRTAADEGES